MQDNKKPSQPASEPSPIRERPYSIVVGSDFSELGDRAIVEGIRLCALHSQSALYVVTVGAESPAGVILPGGELREQTHAEALELSRAHIAELTKSYGSRGAWPPGLDKIAICVLVGSAAERLMALAETVDADMIVIGTHARRGIQRLLLGSVAEEVVRRAPCGVLVVRPRDFLGGERLPAIEPPLQPGEHALVPYIESTTYHYVDRLTEGTSSRLMPAI